MIKYKLFGGLLIFALGALAAGCNVPLSNSASGEPNAPRAWFDAPLPNTVVLPPSPCQIMAHGASPSGIASFELSINGAATNLPSPDTTASLVTLSRDCGLSEPGEYLLQLRAQDNAGNWSGYAETSFIIPGQFGQIGGQVVGDLNGNGIQDGNETGLGGAEVALKGCGSTQNQFTNPDGTFQFNQVPAGTCTLEVAKGGWGFSGSFPNLGYPLPLASDPNLPTNVGILMAPVPAGIVPVITPTFTPTLPPTPVPLGGVTVERVSTNLVYLGGSTCGTNEVTILARATAPKGIKVVVLFYRFSTGSASSEFQSVAMNPIGGDLYQRTLNPTSLLSGSIPFDQATLQYQIVVQQTDNDASIRTPVLADIAVQACGRVTVSCSSYSDERTCTTNGCNWVNIPGTVPIYECRNP